MTRPAPMTQPARVDVLVPTRDEEDYIEATLDAIFAQTVPVAVTVVDNGSRDRTMELLRARAAPCLPPLRSNSPRTAAAAAGSTNGKSTRPTHTPQRRSARRGAGGLRRRARDPSSPQCPSRRPARNASPTPMTVLARARSVRF